MARTFGPGMKLGVIVGAWTLFGLFIASQRYLVHAYLGREPSFRETLLNWLLCAYAWALLTPIVVWLGRTFPLDRRRWLMAVLVHLPASIVLSFAGMFLYLVGERLTSANPDALTLASFTRLLNAGLTVDILIYGAIVGACYALDHYRRYRDRELEAVQLQAALAQAELAALKAQLHPHFLFNTLNTIAVLMEEDAVAARKMLVHLSDLLRMVLKKGRTHEVSLREEVELLESYLEIERMRFQDRLDVHVSVDPTALDARVPDLVLQPLVENAIKHGVMPRAQGGRVEVRAHKSGDQLALEVRDDGPGLTPSAQARGTGVGLSNTRVRLAKLYEGRHRFELTNLAAGGLSVLVTLPFRAVAPDDLQRSSHESDTNTDGR